MKKIVVEIIEEVVRFNEVVIEVPDDKSLSDVHEEIRKIETINDIKYQIKEHYVMEDFSDVEVFDVDNYI